MTITDEIKNDILIRWKMIIDTKEDRLSIGLFSIKEHKINQVFDMDKEVVNFANVELAINSVFRRVYEHERSII